MTALAKRQTGTTMIELLVAMLILAIGLLGMLGLQTTSLRNTQSAYLRTQATILAEDIAERMRANAIGVDNGAYIGASGQRNSGCISTSGCSASAMAAHDMAEWLTAIDEALPAGTGRVCRDSTPDDGSVSAPACDGTGGYAIKIWWDSDRDGSANQRFTTMFEP